MYDPSANPAPKPANLSPADVEGVRRAMEAMAEAARSIGSAVTHAAAELVTVAATARAVTEVAAGPGRPARVVLEFDAPDAARRFAALMGGLVRPIAPAPGPSSD